MSHLIRFKPIMRPKPPPKAPVAIRDQPLFDDFLQLANLYKMAFPDYQTTLRISGISEVVDAALTFFCMIEDQYFPLEHMWDWGDDCDNYEIRPWIYQIPVKVVGHDQEVSPIHMTSPKALLARLERVGNYSDEADKHKQVLMCQYPNWHWDGLLDVFQLNQVIDILDDMFLPPPFECAQRTLGDKLPALIRYMTHETGTYFLDYTIEHWPHHIQWSQSNFDWLTSDWETAKMIMDQSDSLCHWLIKNPEQLEKIWTILKIAHQRRNA